jgi:hypothetical protein
MFIISCTGNDPYCFFLFPVSPTKLSLGAVISARWHKIIAYEDEEKRVIKLKEVENSAQS